MKRNVLLIIFTAAILFYSNLLAQPMSKQGANISGFVYDKENGEGLAGANLYLIELQTGSATNSSGYYVIPDLATGMYTLICSYIGYQSDTIKVNLSGENDIDQNFYLGLQSIETEEVVVSGEKDRVIEKLYSKPVSQIQLNAEQINQIPKVIEADLLRSLQSLPGITSLSDYSSALYIRGGTPDQNLYMIDGTDVYNPEHAFGIFSTFNTNAIKTVNISKGGFGAEYGGRLSSVLDVTNLDGNRNKFEGVANISLLSASTTLQFPLGSLGSISGSIRRTYIDQTYANWIDEVPAYYFYDGNIKAFLDLDQKNKLTVSFFSGRDDLDFKFDKNAPESLSFLYDWGNTTGSLNWKHIFSPKLFSSFWFTASRFDSHFDFQAVNFTEDNKISDYSFKASLEYYASNNLVVKFGAEQKFLHEVYDQDSEDRQKIIFDNHRNLTTGYISANWNPFQNLVVEAGLRGNYYNADITIASIEPRLSLKYRLTEESSLKLAMGRYHQYLNRIQRFFITSIWTTANKYVPESMSDHLILGYQREIGLVWQFEAEVYYKTYKNISMFNPQIGADIQPQSYDANNRPVYSSYEDVYINGDGESFGLELLLRKDVGLITGWISYALSQTNYVYDAINQGNYYQPRHNRMHVVNAIFNTNLSKLIFGQTDPKATSRWIFGASFVYASGQPLTVPGSAYYTGRVPDWADLNNPEGYRTDYHLYPSTINAFELPDYIRLDISLTYEKEYNGWSIAPYLQIFNIGNRGNAWFVNYTDEFKDGQIIQEAEKVNMLPLLPSLGITIKF